MLHGWCVPDITTHRSVIGHSHMLAPDSRPVQYARIVIQRLLLKALSRMRKLKYYAQALVISVRCDNNQKLHTKLCFEKTNDSIKIVRLFNERWQCVVYKHNLTRLKKVSVSFSRLVSCKTQQGELFTLNHRKNHIRDHDKKQSLSQALDVINGRYGRDTIIVGNVKNEVNAFSGTKIAFTRIPDITEFDY